VGREIRHQHHHHKEIVVVIVGTFLSILALVEAVPVLLVRLVPVVRQLERLVLLCEVY
jgi:hypothetical protein